jgi:hypothetical protein
MHPAGNLPSPRRRNGLRVALCANVQAPPLRLETTHLESWRTRKLVNLGEHRRLGGHLSDWLKCLRTLNGSTLLHAANLEYCYWSEVAHS